MLISPIRKHQMLRCYGVTASRQAFAMNFIYTQTKPNSIIRKTKEAKSFMAGNWEFQGRKV